MNAILRPTLTPSDRKRIREELFEQLKRKWLFFSEAISEASNSTGTALHNAFIEGDAVLFFECCERALKEHIEACRMVEEAESDLLGSMDVNGKGWLTS